MRTFKTFSQVSDLFPDGLMLLDEQAKVLHANHKLKTDLSLNVEASGYHSFFELAPYDNMLSWRRRWKKLQSVDFHEEETDLLTTRGHTFPARLKYRLIETDKGNLCLITVQNTLQKERFRNLYELSATCSRLGAWEWDLQRDQVYLSRELQTMTGVKTSENPCTVDTFWDIASDHLLPAATAGLKDQFRKLRDADHELRTEIVLSGTPEGKKRFELTGRAVRFDDTPVRIYGTLQDHAAISSRSEEMYMAQFTVENAREMIFWIRADGSIFYVNQAAVDKLGYSRQELTNLHVADIDVDFTPDYWPVHWAELREKKQMEIEATHRTKAGKKFPVEGNLNFIEFEGEYFNCALMRDVSLKKKRDRRIKLAEFTIDAFPDMLLWVKNDGTILHSNPACTQTLGYTKEELHQQRVWDLLPRLDQDSWKAFCLQLRQKKSRTLQNDMLSKSAGRIPTEIAASTLRFEGDELISLHIKDMRQ